MSLPDVAILTVDAGNSRTKMSLFSREGQLLWTAASTDFQALLDSVPADHTVAGVAFCSVGSELPSSFMDRLSAIAPGHMLILSHETPLPITVDYGTPLSLGLDRVAAAAGAASLFPGEALLVVDAGTAVTIDVVDRGATFRGGNISPGADLRFRALHNYTAALPRVYADGPLPRFGSDTESAIRSGVVNGLVAEIDASFRDAVSLFGASKLVLSGGDATLIASLTAVPQSCCSVVTDLVGLGLVSVLNFNDHDEII